MRPYHILLMLIIIALIVMPAVFAAKGTPQKFKIADGENPQVGVDSASGKVAVLYYVASQQKWDVYSTVMKNRVKTGVFKVVKSRKLASNVLESALPFLSRKSEGGGFLSVWTNAIAPTPPFYTLHPGSAQTGPVKLNNALGTVATSVTYPDAALSPVTAAAARNSFIVVYGGYGLLQHDLVGLYTAFVNAKGKAQGQPDKIADGAFGTYTGSDPNLMGTWQFGYEPSDISRISKDRFLVAVRQPLKLNGSALAKNPLSVEYVRRTYSSERQRKPEQNTPEFLPGDHRTSFC